MQTATEQPCLLLQKRALSLSKELLMHRGAAPPKSHTDV